LTPQAVSEAMANVVAATHTMATLRNRALN
jgi:hypothetical protein